MKLNITNASATKLISILILIEGNTFRNTKHIKAL